MARSDQLTDLVKAGVQGDMAAAGRTAEAVAAEERAKKREGVADRITRALAAAELNRTRNLNARGNQAAHAIASKP